MCVDTVTTPGRVGYRVAWAVTRARPHARTRAHTRATPQLGRRRYDMAVFIHREFRTMQAMVQYVFMRSVASPGYATRGRFNARPFQRAAVYL